MAQKSGGIAAKVEQLVKPVVEEQGLRLWDVRYEKEGANWFLRVWIDRDTPLDTDACEQVSRAIDPILDKADLIQDSYFLEVGGPGIGRRLERSEHYTAKTGQEVMVHLIRPNDAGEREFVGILLGQIDGFVHLRTEHGDMQFDEKAMSYCKLQDDTDLFG